MFRRLFAIAFIYGCTAVAWVVLGGTIFKRTYAADSRLKGSVGSTWGVPQSQRAPVGYTLTTDAPPRPTERPLRTNRPAATKTEAPTEVIVTKNFLPLDQTRASVVFDLDHRQKGLLWYSTYAVSFTGAYNFR